VKTRRWVEGAFCGSPPLCGVASEITDAIKNNWGANIKPPPTKIGIALSINPRHGRAGFYYCQNSARRNQGLLRDVEKRGCFVRCCGMAHVTDSDLYTQAGELLRHYLSWREKLLGGYVAVIAALAVAFDKFPEQYKNRRPLLAVLGVILTAVFWLLERRNRELFNRCITAGVGLEKKASLAGAFTELDKKPSTPTHSTVLDGFFGLAMAALLVVAIALWRSQG
jgi:hypothetical protein